MAVIYFKSVWQTAAGEQNYSNKEKTLIQWIELFLSTEQKFLALAKFACFDVTYPNHWVCKGITYSAVIFPCSAALQAIGNCKNKWKKTPEY